MTVFSSTPGADQVILYVPRAVIFGNRVLRSTIFPKYPFGSRTFGCASFRETGGFAFSSFAPLLSKTWKPDSISIPGLFQFSFPSFLKRMVTWFGSPA
jgi:hypothetical protein